MSFLRHIIGKSIGNFFQVVFNFKMLVILTVTVLSGVLLENKKLEMGFGKGIALLIISLLISVWIFQKMIEIIREVDGEKYNANLVLTNLLRIIWNGILVLVVIAIIGLITFTVAGSAYKTSRELGIIIGGVGVIVYLWYVTKIVFFPYCIVADGLDNPISVSLGLTENKFFKVVILEILCHILLYYETKLFDGVDIKFFLIIKTVLITLTSLFILILYYNGYERLKEFQYEK